MNTVFHTLALIVAAATAQPVVIPQTRAGTVLQAWLTAFNSGDRTTFKNFLETYERQRLKVIDGLMAFETQTGGFVLRKIESSTPAKIVALVQEKNSDQFARLVFEVQDAPLHRIATASLDAIARPAEFPIAALSEDDLIAQAKERAAAAAAAGRFSGAVLIAKNGAPVFAQAYGEADRATHVPNTLETRFRLGSMNKMFTATAIMQLVQAGKIGLDKPFGTYLTDYPNKSVSSAVTIRQLLTHTGGTGDIFGPEFMKNRLKLRTLQDYVDLYGHRGLLFKPGTKWDYSNYGFILLGAIIERVSGQSYYDYVREHVYAPAGMTSTGSDPEDASVNRRSIGYTQSPDGKWMPNTDMLPYRGTSAGGGYSTVGDLLKFANALLAHKLLDAQYTDMMTHGQVATPGGGRYGFGFGDHIVQGMHCYGHNGGAPGMNGMLDICPQDGYVVAVLANMDPPAAENIGDWIVNRL